MHHRSRSPPPIRSKACSVHSKNRQPSLSLIYIDIRFSVAGITLLGVWGRGQRGGNIAYLEHDDRVASYDLFVRAQGAKISHVERCMYGRALGMVTTRWVEEEEECFVRAVYVCRLVDV